MTLDGLTPNFPPLQPFPLKTPTAPLAPSDAQAGAGPRSAPSAGDAWAGSDHGRPGALALSGYDAALPFDTLEAPAEPVPGDLAGSLRHVGPGALDQGASTFLQEVWSNALGGYQAAASPESYRSALESAGFELASAS